MCDLSHSFAATHGCIARVHVKFSSTRALAAPQPPAPNASQGSAAPPWMAALRQHATPTRPPTERMRVRPH